LQLHLDLKDCHRKCELSTTGLGLLKYLPYGSIDANIGHITHNDLGTLAIVFFNKGGLQVFMPGLEDWRYIAPKPGNAIVNVGDSLTALSKGALRSCLHRVVPPPDAWDQTKFSLVYLMRPEYDTVFTTSDGKKWRSLDWHNRKFTVLRATDLVQSQDSDLTGCHGFIGLAGTPSMTKS
jgi:isopenicillin N synthase-like dioxygenase